MATVFESYIQGHRLSEYQVFMNEFRRAAQRVAEQDRDPAVARLVISENTFNRWRRGEVKPQRDARRVLHQLTGASVDSLWATENNCEGPQSADVAAPDGYATSASEMRRRAQMAARRAEEFAMGTERGIVGDERIGFVTDRVQALIEQYPRVALPQIWDDLFETQDQVFRLIESGRAKPSQLRDLHVLATIVSFHASKASHDMGDPYLALTQARAAGVCAEQAEYPGLVALSYGLRSLIAFWAGRPSEAMHYAQRGTAANPQATGTSAVWLRSLEGRAAAALGREEAAMSAIQQGQRLRGAVRPDELDRLGGLLAFPEARQAYYTAETRVLLGHGGPEVTSLTEGAVKALSDRTSPEWSFSDLAGAQCALAASRLSEGELDGVADAVRPVLDLSPGLRTRGIVLSTGRVASALQSGPHAAVPLATSLAEEIEAYPAARMALPGR
ncbi:hypothetical protein [Streptomyces spiramenti]|uniref:XRE family transcriptional regulator n=1 Tax=Streptomyces spiramenti TaxID=2720606 RepID=A0ABX1AIY1_9ACTN|nr:hypothetical protein [Streptomyces spiramenti]NJP65338.1 hypothetical protein [Streptomyces spiramenti]